MGRVRTAAAKKYIEKTPSSGDDNDESLADVKRSSRSKKTAIKSQTTPSASKTRASRGTRSSTVNDKQNGKNGVSVSDASDSGDDAPILNRKRKTPNENASPKKAKPSTSTAKAKSKEAENKSKKDDSKAKKKGKEERYEVEEILDHKFEDNVKYFLIRWKGYDSSVDSWESQYSISCPALLAKYYEEHPEASVSAKKRSKKRKPVVPKPRQLKIDEQLDYDSDWDENEDYEVDRILDVCIHRDNKREFLIRWKGYSSNSDSWEPEENLDCKDLIEKFMGKVEQMKNATQKDLRPVRSQTQRFTLMTQAAARRLSKRNLSKQRAVYYDCDE